ncbi:MAG: hypothetical protein Q8K65_07545 [Alphaproteobacteria bacterium]|nr:hypothetical protein [Alphaproteobacteria bacterium]
MDESSYQYAVLRRFLDFSADWPKIPEKAEFDVLVEDRALPVLKKKYGAYKKKQGVEFDFYTPEGTTVGGEMGVLYFPPRLSRKILDHRYKWNGLFYVPDAQSHLLSLLYHVCYRKTESSGIHMDDPTLSNGSRYLAEIEWLKSQLGLNLDDTLFAYHGYLRAHECNATYETLVAYVQKQFAKDVKSMFMAQLFREFSGEMNMFVIRGISVKTGLHTNLINMLREHFKTILVKDIPLAARLVESGKMRGGKWRRGGRPRIVVLVFDPHPQEATEEDRKIQAYVFNSRQFVKREFRTWFRTTTKCKPSANPLHSTDNEAEAVGHFPLFFSAHEQEDIFLRLKELRSISS